MTRRVPASVRTRESLSDLIEGRLSSAAGRAELVKLATRLIVEEALEAESRDALGRDYYEHGASPGEGWRNGVRLGRLKTAEGLVDYGISRISCGWWTKRPRSLAHVVLTSVLSGKLSCVAQISERCSWWLLLRPLVARTRTRCTIPGTRMATPSGTTLPARSGSL